ncbi:MAG: hypothetical protein Q7K65_01530 [Candidatus Buchananbacteria bacterium]|nr:hypothetical protein [Candidatus Buchananbacteria bacterium]
MPLFRQSQIQKHTPKTIKLENLYKHLLDVKDLSQSDKVNLMKALQETGYNYSSASKILNEKDLDILQAKKLAGNLAKTGLKGFAENDPNKLVNNYTRSEAIKKKNVAGRRRELMMESLQEDIYKDKTPRSKTLGKPVTPKPKSGGKMKLGF